MPIFIYSCRFIFNLNICPSSSSTLTYSTLTPKVSFLTFWISETIFNNGSIFKFHLDHQNMWPIFNSTNHNSEFPPYNFNLRNYSQPLIKTAYNLHRPSVKGLPHFTNFNCSFIHACSISIILLYHRFIPNLISIIEKCTPFKPFRRFEM